jgi:hypothetical protein
MLIVSQKQLQVFTVGFAFRFSVLVSFLKVLIFLSQQVLQQLYINSIRVMLYDNDVERGMTSFTHVKSL